MQGIVFIYSCLTFNGNLTAEQLGFNGYIPSYASARGRQILRGVNYASAAAGIREETGQQLVPIFCFAFNNVTYDCLFSS